MGTVQMTKIELVRELIKREIVANGALVRNACQNEMLCFQDYLTQKKAEYEAMPLDVLLSMVEGYDLRGAA